MPLPASGRATRRTWHSTASRRWRWRRRAGPTSWCSTSCCRASTAWRRCAASARWEAGARAIILLTARGEESDRIVGLRLGADDYIVKPFSPAELVARVDAVLRRIDTVPEQQPPLRFDGLVVDPGGRRVRLDGEDVVLTQREFELLLFLARHPGQAFTRNQLMDHVWGYSFYTDTSTVTVHIRRLRAKLEETPEHPRWIETVWGVGYRFAA